MEQEYTQPFDLLNPGVLLEDQEKYQKLEQQLNEIRDGILFNQNQGKETKNRQPDFIGAHPVSMSTQRFNNVWTHPNDWYICEKTDGVRYLLLIMSNGEIYLTGRKTGVGNVRRLQFFACRMKLPQNMFKREEDSFQIMYLFDGELCVDKYINIDQKIENPYQKINKFFIFDTIICRYNPVYQENYIIRLKHAEYFKKWKKVLKGLQKQMKQKATEHLRSFRGTVREFGPIKLVVKDFYVLDQSEYLLNYYIKNLPHLNDGLIFTEIDPPYKCGTNYGIIKWKPPHMNTIDFLVAPNNVIGQETADLYVILDDTRLFFGQMALSQDFRQQLEENMEQLEQERQDMIQDNGGEDDGEDVKGVVCECRFGEIEEDDFLKIQSIYDQDLSELLAQSVYNQDEEFSQNERIQEMFSKQKDLLNRYKNKGWIFDKFRIDKTKPNNVFIAVDIVKTIEENITSQYIIDKIHDKVGQQQAINVQMQKQQQKK